MASVLHPWRKFTLRMVLLAGPCWLVLAGAALAQPPKPLPGLPDPARLGPRAGALLAQPPRALPGQPDQPPESPPEPDDEGPFSGPTSTSPAVRALLRALQSAQQNPSAAPEAIARAAANLRTLPELVQGYCLEGWPSETEGAQLPRRLGQGLDRENLGMRVIQELGAALKGGPAHRRAAAAALLADMARSSPQGPQMPGHHGRAVLLVADGVKPELKALAEDRDPGLRQAAAQAFGRMPFSPAPSLEALVTRDGEVAVRRAAAAALARRAAQRSAYVLGPADADAGRREPARKPRGPDEDQQPREQGNDLLPEGFQRGRPFQAQEDVIRAALAGLEANEDAEVCRLCVEAVAAAIDQVGQENPWARPNEFPGREGPLPGAAAAIATAEKLACQVIPAVTRRLADKDEATVIGACTALEAAARLGWPALLQWSNRRVAGGQAVRKELGPEVARALADLVGGSRGVDVRLAAIYVLEEMHENAAPAAEIVAGALGDEDSFIRWGAARALGRMAPAGAEAAVPALAARVGDANGDVRVTALAALRRYGPEAAPASAAVAALLGKSDPVTQRWACQVLEAVGEQAKKASAASLAQALQATNADVRAAAAEALRAFGSPDEATAAALRRALDDDNARVRRAAAEALLNAREAAPPPPTPSNLPQPRPLVPPAVQGGEPAPPPATPSAPPP